MTGYTISWDDWQAVLARVLSAQDDAMAAKLKRPWDLHLGVNWVDKLLRGCLNKDGSKVVFNSLYLRLLGVSYVRAVFIDPSLDPDAMTCVKAKDDRSQEVKDAVREGFGIDTGSV